MKRSSLFTPALGLAFGLCASGAYALTTTNAFENFTCENDTAVTNLPTANGVGFAWSAGADAVDYTYAEAATGKLVVDTGSSSVTGRLSNATAFNNNIANTASFEAKVTFTPATDTPAIDNSDLKFALYAKAAAGSTTLYVYANGGETNTEIAVAANTEETVKVDFLSASTFQVSVNGGEPKGPYSFYSGSGVNLVEFQGNGKVDDIAFTYTTSWYDYLGAPVDGAYQIDDADDLKALRAGVAAGLGTSGLTFKQTADIDMSSAGAFAGIGAYEKVPTAGTPFLGTYNGQGYTISNVTRAGGDTQGIFNQVGPSGVIENLVVSNMVFATDVSGEYGFAIVGNAGGGATLRNLTAAGTFGSASKPSSHNMAGIVVRLAPGATSGAATTIDSCTNNATIYGGYTKLGGINAIVQNQTGFVDGKVVFVNCANNGTLVCKRTAADVTGNAGIVGYIAGTNVELTGCYGNGVITNEDGANTDKDGALVGWTDGGTIKDNGGNSAPANKKMIGTWGSATETGFLYATVDNGVATTISGSPVAGGSYLLEGNATPSITLALGESITFNTSLGYTLTDTSITAGSGCEVVPSGTTDVKTFTAAEIPSYSAGQKPVEGEGGSSYSISAEEATYLNTLVGNKGGYKVEAALDTISAEDFSAAFLLNQDITEGNPGSYSFDITKISKSGSTVTVTASLVRKGTVIGAINGTATLYSASTPALLESAPTKQSQTFSLPNAEKDAPATASVTFTGADKFFKVVIE